MLQLPPIPEIPELLRGRQLVVVEAAFLGDEGTGRELLRPLLDLEPELDTFATVPARGLTELHQDPPGPVPGRGEGWMLDAFDAAAAEAIVRGGGAWTGRRRSSRVEVRHLDGALGRPDPNGGVLSHLEAPYAMYSVGVAPGPRPSPRSRGASRRSAPRRRRGSHGSTYFNFAEGDVDPSVLYPAGAYERLTAIRAEVDPDGLFRAKHTID